MNRTQIYLTDVEHKFFKKEAYEKDVSMSEAIRFAMDEYIEKRTKLEALKSDSK
jgi:hypothetical protein